MTNANKKSKKSQNNKNLKVSSQNLKKKKNTNLNTKIKKTPINKNDNKETEQKLIGDNNIKKNKIKKNSYSEDKNTKSSTIKTKSNYHKVKEKVSKQQKIQNEKDKRKKEIKKKKHEVRIQKQEEIKNRTLFKKIKLILLSIFIKTKNFFLKRLVKMKKNIIKKYNCIKSFITKLLKKKVKNKVCENSANDEIKQIEYLKNDKELQTEIDLEEVNKKDVVLKSLFGRVLPMTFTKGDKKRRKTIYLKEGLVLSISLTLIDLICFYKVPTMNILTIFDNNIWNLVATFCFSLLVLLVCSYLIDYLITEFTLRRLRKKNKKSKAKNKKNKKQGD